MNKMNRKSVMSMMAAAISSACLLGTPVMAAQDQPVKNTFQTIAVKSNANKGYAAGLDTINNKKAENNAAGAMVKTGKTEIEGKTFYLDSFGQPVNGIVSLPEGDYYFSSEEGMKTGFVSENGATYHFDETTGLKSEGTFDKDGKTYVLDENGATQTGWVEKDGSRQYLAEDGSVVKNETREIEGIRYSFDGNGQVETNITKDGWTYDEQGRGSEDLSGYDKIAQAALAQLGVHQDCTRLVTNSLAAAGIHHHGAPASYLSLGPLTDNPVPGDIIVYQGHVAIYIGNGQAVHGGWNGYTTEIFSVECSTPLIGFVHPILP